MLGVYNYFDILYRRATMFRAVVIYCNTAQTTKMDMKQAPAERYTKCLQETTRLKVKWLPNDKHETDKTVLQRRIRLAK